MEVLTYRILIKSYETFQSYLKKAIFFFFVNYEALERVNEATWNRDKFS